LTPFFIFYFFLNEKNMADMYTISKRLLNALTRINEQCLKRPRRLSVYKMGVLDALSKSIAAASQFNIGSRRMVAEECSEDDDDEDDDDDDEDGEDVDSDDDDGDDEDSDSSLSEEVAGDPKKEKEEGDVISVDVDGETVPPPLKRLRKSK
jgi:hypothetical protein